MGKKQLIFIISLSILFLGSVPLIQFNDLTLLFNGSINSTFMTEINGDQVSTTEFIKKDLVKDWTFMTYLDGDNNLEEAAISDMQELELGGGTNADINVVILIDRNAGYDTSNGNWDGGRYYEITADTSPNIDSTLLVDLGEVEMDAQNTLRDFIKYCFANYPAEKYCLNLWDHGGGIFGVCWDDTTGSSACLSLNEVQQAIKEATQAYTETIDILSFDCCVMGMIEMAFEVRNYCDYVVFSEESIPFNGYNYEPIISGLQANPSMDAYDFSKLLVDSYAQTYLNTDSTCLSVIDLNTLKDTIPYINDFAGNLTYAITTLNYDYNANLGRGTTRSFYNTIFVDLIDYAQRINYFVDYDPLIHAANELIQVINNSIVYNWQHESLSGTANGLSIFLPVSSYSLPEGAMYHYANRTSYCTGLDFPGVSSWGEFIRSYYDYYQLMQPQLPTRLMLNTQTSNLLINQNHHQEYIITFANDGVYDITFMIASGDVDFRIAASFSSGIEYYGYSKLINPDDSTNETCRVYLKANLYYIFIKGIAPSSTYKILITKYNFPTITINKAITATGGSTCGDGTGHFIQHLQHYYSVNLLIDLYTFKLNNSATTNYQLVLYNDNWQIVGQAIPITIGENLVFQFNCTSAQVIHIKIHATVGAGAFILEVNGLSPTDLQGLSILLIPLFITGVLGTFVIFKKRK
ncbi:MAG: hypothetical protein JXA54_05025 [Candidatus Heimdallarchaeota archaeon]|nr:hypothetical protein [Candidatus Heimdallarchaeota archaeon]